MPTVSEMLRPYPIPPVAKTRQFFCDTVLSDPEAVLRQELETTCAPIRPGDRIAITCGSRGIDQYVPLLRTIVDFVKSRGGAPFLVPSMGSHGGATAEVRPKCCAIAASVKKPSVRRWCPPWK